MNLNVEWNVVVHFCIMLIEIISIRSVSSSNIDDHETSLSKERMVF